MKKFTLPFQELLIKEIHKAHEEYINNAEMPHWILKNNDCQCLFFRKYLLPCRHFFYLDIYGDEDVLTEDYWSDCIAAFGDCGLDVYKSKERFFVPRFEEEQNIDCDRLNFSSRMENMNDIFLRIKESKNDTLIKYMDNHLETMIDYLNSQMSGTLAIS